MNPKQILHRYRYVTRKLAALEADFDAFVRRNMDKPELRQAKAQESNKVYFKLKAELQGLRELFAVAKGNEISAKASR